MAKEPKSLAAANRLKRTIAHEAWDNAKGLAKGISSRVKFNESAIYNLNSCDQYDRAGSPG